MKVIPGLKEEDFMTLRWNADVHTVRRRNGEYRILNNRGICLGEMIEENGLYKITLYEETSETNNIETVAKQIINKELGEPEITYKKDNIINLLSYRTQRNKRVTRDYPRITNYLAA